MPITIDRIPKVDAVVISHNHYDHLDYDSVRQLHNKFGKGGLNWFCGLNTGEFFRSCGITENVHELNWWESRMFNGVKFVFTPSQHWCSRLGPSDRNKVNEFDHYTIRQFEIKRWVSLFDIQF